MRLLLGSEWLDLWEFFTVEPGDATKDHPLEHTNGLRELEHFSKNE